MLKKILIIFLYFTFVLVLAKTTESSQKTTFQAPTLSNSQSWTMVVIPDIQTYIKQIENHGILDMMFAWMVRQKKVMNIRQVLFTGDLVYYNDMGGTIEKDGILGKKNDLISKEQYKAVSRLMERLDGHLPYVLCTGNHDYGITCAQNRNTWFNEFFPTDRNPCTREQLFACDHNAFGINTLENSAYEFQEPPPNNRKFLVITLQFAPTDANLKWARSVADDPRFANHFGILLTHSYMRANGERIQSEDFILNQKGGNAGEQIFQKLVYPSKNIRMVVCGHVCRPDNWEASVGFSTAKNSSGKTVAQMVFNTQAIGGGYSGNGGDGWLRLLEFMPDKKTIKATTFSPFFASSPSTRYLAWKRDARNQFTFELE